MSKVVRIGTGKSTLALTQTRLMAGELKRACLGLEIEAVTEDMPRDRILDRPLQELGGKGAFVSRFEQAIKAETTDLAVHSAKDLPVGLAPGLCIAAVSHHEDPRGMLVAMKGTMKTGKGIIGIGTSSPRRQLEAMENHEISWPGLKGV